MKLVVNAILGVEMQAIAEAIALGEAEGLDRARLLDVLSQTDSENQDDTRLAVEAELLRAAP